MKITIGEKTATGEDFCFCSNELATSAHRFAFGEQFKATRQPAQELGLIVFFMGRIFNLKKLCAHYEVPGYEPEKLIAIIYRKVGTELAKVLDGAYAIAILDGDALSLLRDREGFENLYYAKRGTELVIGTKVREIGKVLKLGVNQKALPRYFVLDQLNNEDTFFADVYQVKIFEWLSVNLSAVQCHSETYDQIAYSLLPDLGLNDAEVANGIEDLLCARIENLISYFPGSPIYNNQSGDTDSALTQCLLRELGHNQSVCANFEDIGSDAKYSSDVAAFLKSSHEVIHVARDDFLRNMSEGIKVIGQPLIFEGECLFNHMAKVLGSESKPERPLICFDSNGADAILGHGRILMALSLLIQLPGFFNVGQKLARGFLAKDLRQILPKLLKGLREDNFSADFFFAAFSLLNRVALVRQAFELDDVDWIPEYELSQQHQYPVDFLEKVYRLQVFQHEARRISNTTYQLAKRNNIVMLYPFRDSPLIRFMLDIPTERKLKHWIQKYHGKKLLQRYLPSNLVYRKEINRGGPFGELFQKEPQFKRLIEEIKDCGYDYFNFDYDKVFSTPGLEAFAIKLINFHLWHRDFID